MWAAKEMICSHRFWCDKPSKHFAPYHLAGVEVRSTEPGIHGFSWIDPQKYTQNAPAAAQVKLQFSPPRVICPCFIVFIFRAFLTHVHHL